MKALAPHDARRPIVLRFGAWPVVMTETPVPHPATAHAALIQAIAEHGDRDAFGILFRHFAPRVKAWLLRAGATGTQAEELAQETMLAVWRKPRLFDPNRAGAATWIFTIARNMRIDALRRERHPDTLLADPTHTQAEPPRADHLLAAEERDDRVRAAMATLSAEQAEVVRLAFFLDKPHAEIERELGIPLGTVKSRLRLAMTKLRAALEDWA